MRRGTQATPYHGVSNEPTVQYHLCDFCAPSVSSMT